MKSSKKKPEPSPALPLETNAGILLAGRTATLFRQLARAQRDLTEDAVHDLRVATRRFRECLRVFREILGGRRYGKPLRLARRLRRLLGPLRNADVARGSLDEIVSAQPGGPEAGAAGRYRRVLLRRRKKMHRDVSRQLERVEFDWLPGRVGELVRGFRRASPAPLSRETIEAVLSERFDAAFSLKAQALRPPNVEAQHRLRIALKKCRYSLEVLRFAFGEEGEKTLKQIEGFQDQLGALRDLDVLLWNMNEWLGSRKKAPPGAEAQDFEALKAHLQQKRRELHGRFAETFRPVQRKRLLDKLMRDLSPEMKNEQQKTGAKKH